MTNIQNNPTKQTSLNVQRHLIKTLARHLEVIDLCDQRIRDTHAQYFQATRQEAVEAYAATMVELIKEVVDHSKPCMI